MNVQQDSDTLLLGRGSTPLLFLVFTVTILIAHVLVLGLLSSTLVASNVCQLLAPVLAVTVCLSEGRHHRDAYHRRLWGLLAIAFLMWTVAQGYFLYVLLRFNVAAPFPSLADLLWLLFAFPILLAVVTRRPGTETDWVSWIDAAQAATFFGVLCVLVFSPARIVPVWVAYDVQDGALCLAVAWRYFSGRIPDERRFFRILGMYLLTYGGMSSLANRLQQTPSKLADVADLSWSLPPLLFCVLVCVSPGTVKMNEAAKSGSMGRLRKHLSGWSALGLSLMSLSTAAVLHSHRPLLGFCCLLLAMLLFAVRTSARESQLRDARDCMEHAAFHDSLTGLPNRGKLLSTIHELASCRSTKGFAVVYLDLDRFKAVNDSFGHSVGNRLLLEVARELQSVVPNCLLARLGGDEFVLLLTMHEELTVLDRAEAITRRLQHPVQVGNRSFYVTASIGISLGGLGSSGEDLLREADCAMYVAKAEGRNRIRVFDQAMHERASEALAFETDLRIAVEEQSFEIAYQPIYSAQSSQAIGMEALSRWFHPQRGTVPPDKFIPVAEETGLIVELGKQVLEKACAQVYRWNLAQASDLYVSVNLSAKQLLDPGLIATVGKALENSGLLADHLKVEVTESVLLDEFDFVCSVLNSLRSMGVQIYLDDFGTGYSSLQYLLRLPFDVVKIDRSFVTALNEDPRRFQMLKTVVDLSHALGKGTIAEGVESAVEHRCLDSIACDAYQGYLFSKPLSPPQMEDFLKRDVLDFTC